MVRYPELERYSIGWRMGYGESYVMVWWAWWDTAFSTATEKYNYFRRHNLPVEWLDWISLQMWSEQDDIAVGVAELCARLG